MVRKIPWRKKWQSIPIFLPEKSHWQKYLEGYSTWVHKESDTTEHICTHTSYILYISNILQEIQFVFLIQKITFYFILEYSWLALLCQFQISSKVIHVSILFLIIFPFRFFYNIEQNYLCYTVGTYWLFILHTAVCTCQL